MSGIELRGVTSNQQSQGAKGSAGSSPAEREYANAVKELARLQSKLASSAAGGGEVSAEQTAADQEAITLAAARVAMAAAAVAQERQKAAEERSNQSQSAPPAVSTADLVAEEQRAARLSRVDRTA